LVDEIRPRAAQVRGLLVKADARHDSAASALMPKPRAKNKSIEILMALNVAPTTTSVLVESLRP
jgi:hypothetical protein